MRYKTLTGVFAGILFSSILTAQPLFTYGTKAVNQAEFLRAFEKNPDPGDRKKAMEEYLPLYINYKLKVQDAIDRKMDTLPNQKTELDNYRNQLVESFLNEKSNADMLVQEAFERSQKDILLGYLFIGFDASDSGAIKKAGDLANKALALLKAKEDFAAVVNQYSTDSSNKAAGGEAGWITAFSLPYNYETAVYNLPVSGYTEVFKSTGGYLIFKKISERPAEGRLRIAQIMLINADKGNTDKDEKMKLLADSLYDALQKGAAFDTIAQQFSNDRTSYGTGGILPDFGVGSYDKNFEQQAYSLKKKGDISKPFQTEYGWHILKLIDKFPVAKTLAEADLNGELKQKVLTGGRAESARAKYIKSQMTNLGYKPAPLTQQLLWQYTDSSLNDGNTKALKMNEKTPVLLFGKQNVNAGDWMQFIKQERMNPLKANSTYDEMFQDFIQSSTEDQLKKNLDKIEPSFALQVKEFKDANLLFEAMDKNVWNKAAEDSAGLAKYYQQHKTKYRWGASAAALLVTSTDSTIAGDVYKGIKENPQDWRKLTEKYPENLIADSGRFELTQIPVESQTSFSKGMVTTPVKNAMDGSQTFASIYDLLPADQQRSFEEARGFVINDYQQVLEERWLTALKKKYPVKMNDAIWKKLLASK